MQHEPNGSTPNYGGGREPWDAHVVRFVDLGEANRIDSFVNRFRACITGTGHIRHADLDQAAETDSEDETRRIGRELRAAIFDPVLAQISAPARVVVAPDGQLSLIPFETLPDKASAYLIDRYEFNYVVTGNDLRVSKSQKRVVPSSPVVLANPDFDARSGILLASDEAVGDDCETEDKSPRLGAIPANFRFRALPGTRAEGRAVGTRLGVRPLIGEDASKQAVLQLRSPRLLHLATHGFFIGAPSGSPEERNRELCERSTDDTPLLMRIMVYPLLRSGVALAGANTWLAGERPPSGAGNGLLLAEEVLSLDLRGTELVVLSACETGLGSIQVGEGIFGLRRVFRLAGAHCQVISLWRVFDDDAADLMERYYELVTKRTKPVGRAAALRQAQLEMKKKRPHPARWGGFVCEGDSGPICWENGRDPK